MDFFEKAVRRYARPTEIASFEALVKTALRAIDRDSSDFELYCEDLCGRNFAVLWRQEWFVIDRFKWLADSAHLFPDEREHAQLVGEGKAALDAKDVEKLRTVVSQFDRRRLSGPTDDDLVGAVNIVRG